MCCGSDPRIRISPLYHNNINAWRAHSELKKLDGQNICGEKGIFYSKLLLNKINYSINYYSCSVNTCVDKHPLTDFKKIKIDLMLN